MLDACEVERTPSSANNSHRVRPCIFDNMARIPCAASVAAMARSVDGPSPDSERKEGRRGVGKEPTGSWEQYVEQSGLVAAQYRAQARLMPSPTPLSLLEKTSQTRSRTETVSYNALARHLTPAKWRRTVRSVEKSRVFENMKELRSRRSLDCGYKSAPPSHHFRYH